MEDMALRELHQQVVQALLDKVKSGEATASDLNVARQFLKDNGINCDGARQPPLDTLVDSLPDNLDYLSQ